MSEDIDKPFIPSKRRISSSIPIQFRVREAVKTRFQRLAEERSVSMTTLFERLIGEEEERQAGMKLGRLELILNAVQETHRMLNAFHAEGMETRKRLADHSGVFDRFFTRFDHVIAILKSQEQETRGRDGELVSLIETMLQLSSVTAARIQALSETSRNEDFQRRAQELIRQLQE